MDIFDLSFDEFNKKVDSILNEFSAEDLLQELIDNGLIVEQENVYVKYTNLETSDNVWIHKNRTTGIDKIISKFSNKKENMMEAA